MGAIRELEEETGLILLPEELVNISEVEFMSLIQKFENLQGTHKFGENSFDWSDHGKIYAYIHKIAYNFIM